MKSISAFVLCAIFFVTSSLAQTTNRRSFAKKHHQLLNQLLEQNPGATANKMTAGIPSERILAQSTRDSTSNLSDSVELGYSSQFRGSSYDFNVMLYPYNYPYNTTPMFNYAGVSTKPKVLYDTCIHWQINPYTLAYGLYEMTYSSYDTAKNLIACRDLFADSVTDQNMVYKNSFNAMHNITKGIWCRDSLGTLDSGSKQLFAYNSNNKITADSIYEYHSGAWHIVSRTYYTYDTAKNLIKIDWYANTTDTTYPTTFPEQAQYLNTYDTSHRLLTVFTKFYDGTALTQFAKDTFGYTGASAFHTSWREHEWDNINAYWTPYFNMTKHLNSVSLPDTVEFQGWDSLANAWVPQALKIISYNVHNNPDSLWEFDYNFNHYPFNPSFTTKYYYTPYINNTGLTNFSAADIAFSIYPNPANQTLHIISSEIITQPFQIELYDMQGRLLMRDNYLSQNKTTTINMDNLDNGIYILAIRNSNGVAVCRKEVVKR